MDHSATPRRRGEAT
jgi:hypothetical protein